MHYSSYITHLNYTQLLYTLVCVCMIKSIKLSFLDLRSFFPFKSSILLFEVNCRHRNAFVVSDRQTSCLVFSLLLFFFVLSELYLHCSCGVFEDSSLRDFRFENSFNRMKSVRIQCYNQLYNIHCIIYSIYSVYTTLSVFTPCVD